ncbi:hypothetical protein CB1_001028005 [Camelus ferus]|nr:hypothetical protein CB1_001028005 [Camelus ferus]
MKEVCGSPTRFPRSQPTGPKALRIPSPDFQPEPGSLTSSQLWLLQLHVSKPSARAPTADPRRCACPLQPHTHLQLALTTRYVQTTNSGHHCLSWDLAPGPTGTTEDLKGPCSHCGPPPALAKDHTVVDVVDSCYMN